jgi:hypothetical protein
VRGPLGGDPHRQREQAAAGGDLGGRGRLGVHPVIAQELAQQAHRLRLGQRADGDRRGAAAGQQAGQPAPAGDQHQAARRPGQQRPELTRRPRIIQHDQQPLASQQRPVQRGRLVLIKGDPLGRRPQGAQESPQRLHRVHRLARGMTPQVHEQLPVGKAASDLVCPVHGQSRLPGSGRPGDHHDRGPGVSGTDRVQAFEVFPPADEARGAGRQLARGRRLPQAAQPGADGHGKPRVTSQYLLVQAPHRW